jgi:predicted DNA-binding ribbon-helix-helix protein
MKGLKERDISGLRRRGMLERLSFHLEGVVAWVSLEKMFWEA